ncbi:MAG: 30S ribosomal protein S8 [Clostridia bacterium]
MAMTDPIADMLTRIRNALTAKHELVKIPASKIKMAIADILVEEGYIKSAKRIEDENGVQDTILVELKYGANYSKVITGIKRISKPGLRVYAKSDELPKVLNGLGIAIISTSKGVMTDRTARLTGAGGEVLAYIW